MHEGSPNSSKCAKVRYQYLGVNIGKTNLSKKPKVFYGYRIIVAAFFCVFIYSGLGFYSFSLFVRPLQADFGWGRGEIMAAFTVLFLVIGAASPIAGRVVDRYGVRIVAFTGALIMGLGFVLLSLMHNLWHFYVGGGMIGIGMTALGPIPATAIVSNWFKKRRGVFLGIMSSGIGAGGLALAPLLGGYFIPNFGWRTSYLAMALLTWVLITPLVLLVMKTKPADVGLYPDGMEVPGAITVNPTLPPTTEGLTLKMALATPAFWLIGISFLINDFSQISVIQSQVPHLEDIGFPVATAAGALGGVGLGSLVGKFFFGWLCDQISPKYAFSIALVLVLTGITILMNIGPESSLAILWFYAIIMGLGQGGWLPSMSMLTSTNFGLASYGTIFGMLALIQSIGDATGPLMAGYMYDAMNTYHLAFIISIILCVVAIAAILMVRRPKSPYVQL